MSPFALRLLLPAFVLLAGCAGSAAATGGPPTATNTGEPTASASPRGWGPWLASAAADHPLVGTAWLVGERRVVSREELERMLSEARFVLLGETHDHPDHHRLQGEVISAATTGTHGPAVAYEMLDAGQQPTIDAYVAEGSHDVDDFATVVGWADSGWPAWSLYRPAFAPVITAGLPIFAAGFPRTQTRRLLSEGLAMLGPELVARYQLDQPLPAALLDPLLDELFSSHCEMVDREQLAPMVEIQRVRDAMMADALLHGAEARGQAVLVAGTGHTRASGVPRALELAGIDQDLVLSVGFVAVQPGLLDPSDYGEGFDVIVLTPAIAGEDPCAAMRGGG